MALRAYIHIHWLDNYAPRGLAIYNCIVHQALYDHLIDIQFDRFPDYICFN